VDVDLVSSVRVIAATKVEAFGLDTGRMERSFFEIVKEVLQALEYLFERALVRLQVDPAPQTAAR
jgi:hypothetical protein